MKLYLVRHGLAGQFGDYAHDFDRPLTDEGQKKTAMVTRRLADLGLKFDRILTSPLVRARQTAEILQSSGLGDSIEEFPPLTPDGDLQEWVNWWRESSYQSENSSLALVGHQPNLGNWAEILVWGHSEEKLFVKKAGIIGIEVPQGKNPIGQCELFLLTSPKWLL